MGCSRSSIIVCPALFSHRAPPSPTSFSILRSPFSILTFSAIHTDPLLVSSLSRCHLSQESLLLLASLTLKILLASLLSSLFSRLLNKGSLRMTQMFSSREEQSQGRQAPLTQTIFSSLYGLSWSCLVWPLILLLEPSLFPVRGWKSIRIGAEMDF